MAKKVVYVFTAIHEYDVNATSVYSTKEKLQEKEFPQIQSDLYIEDELTGDFDTDWETFSDAMEDSDWSFYIAECEIDGDTNWTI